ncbi:TIGR01777 family oxidoreductase [Flavobacterium psychrophilum]|uniref:TIGR01777 family oxidoreductase n=1 Tax=Flavobacterium psychrophilum TaxID=96345 RepID=UPI00090403CB|nr:TIGR01777 family oxidoreductase [Flavobacterium psychrophilum]MBF2092683.1 TIGR01777 family protein [Flavobacterium psychrophilum]OJH13519.1 TIGR01777 family protein [Flavobacterium psychrophilum]SNA73597.1 putative nucleoside-diphosphate sugar epimerase [Flavobacterium psychrophilum]
MKVLITGATGLIGTVLTELLLQNGIKINYLTTNKQKITHQPNYNGFYWSPESGVIDENSLIDVTTIIHLAGASIAKRWTPKYKQEIIESRVLSANLLYNALKNNPHQVKQFISASAIGIYPDSLNNYYTENFTKFENTFLSNVVIKWEESVNQIERLNINVCKLRTGLVLSTKGGALPEILKPIKLGVGSAIGSGKQMQSWIHIHDLANIFLFALQNNLQGIYNAVAPNPVTNYELNYTAAQILDKPFFMPNIPRFIIKLALGEMHTLLFESQNVNAKKIEQTGFEFQYKSIQSALKQLLKK